jgi:hypothetical protein
MLTSVLRTFIKHSVLIVRKLMASFPEPMGNQTFTIPQLPRNQMCWLGVKHRSKVVYYKGNRLPFRMQGLPNCKGLVRRKQCWRICVGCSALSKVIYYIYVARFKRSWRILGLSLYSPPSTFGLI